MQILFSASGKSVKISYQKRELKFEYQVLADIVAKGILAKAGSFAIIKRIKVNWSTILFGISRICFRFLKNRRVMQPSSVSYLKIQVFFWNLHQFPISTRCSTPLQSYLRSGSLTISPSQLLQVKKEISEEKEQAKEKILLKLLIHINFYH